MVTVEGFERPLHLGEAARVVRGQPAAAAPVPVPSTDQLVLAGRGDAVEAVEPRKTFGLLDPLLLLEGPHVVVRARLLQDAALLCYRQADKDSRLLDFQKEAIP